MGLTPTEFGNMLPRTFLNLQRGRTRLFEHQEHQHWERARWMSCLIINPHVKKNLKPTDLVRFPWDSKSKKGKQEDIETLYKKAKFMDKIQQDKFKENAK